MKPDRIAIVTKEQRDKTIKEWGGVINTQFDKSFESGLDITARVMLNAYSELQLLKAVSVTSTTLLGLCATRIQQYDCEKLDRLAWEAARKFDTVAGVYAARVALGFYEDKEVWVPMATAWAAAWKVMEEKINETN